MELSFTRVEISDLVATVTLARPPVNALRALMTRGLDVGVLSGSATHSGSWHPGRAPGSWQDKRPPTWTWS